MLWIAAFFSSPFFFLLFDLLPFLPFPPLPLLSSFFASLVAVVPKKRPLALFENKHGAVT